MLCLLSVLLLALSLLAGCERKQPAQNLVLICIDTVRADTFFSDRISDGLSARLGNAQQYRNASSAAPWTLPSVASTLSGLYPLQHGAGQFQKQPANLAEELPSALNDSAVTLAEMLAGWHFRTAAFSAHPWVSAKFGLEQGFGRVRLISSWQKVTAAFLAWLDQPKPPQRFFAYLHFMEAHDWHQKGAPELEERLSQTSVEMREQLLADASKAACMDESSEICKRNLVYNLAVRELRGAIDHVLQQLEKRKLLKNTLVIVFSDHGEEFWEHKAEDQRHDDPRGISGFGHGLNLYQELLHVPLLVWHPGIAGAVRHDLVSLVDVVPTALAWLGIQRRGDSLPGMKLPAGADPMPADAEPRIVYASGIAYGSEEIAAREGHLKSIQYYPDEHFDYFDLAQDPGEKHPQGSNSMTMRFDVLTGDYIDMKTDVLAAGPELDSQTLEHLKSIGYLQGIEEPSAPEAEGASGQKPADGAGTPSDPQSALDQ